MKTVAAAVGWGFGGLSCVSLPGVWSCGSSITSSVSSKRDDDGDDDDTTRPTAASVGLGSCRGCSSSVLNKFITNWKGVSRCFCSFFRSSHLLAERVPKAPPRLPFRGAVQPFHRFVWKRFLLPSLSLFCVLVPMDRHFAVVGGSPLRGDRYFAGPPDTLAFEAAVIAEVCTYVDRFPWSAGSVICHKNMIWIGRTKVLMRGYAVAPLLPPPSPPRRHALPLSGRPIEKIGDDLHCTL